MTISNALKCLTLPATAGALLLCALPMNAQNGDKGAPKILVTQLELIKPGKTGSFHERTERAFAAAARGAKSTDYYIGMRALTGRPEAFFTEGYDSLAAWIGIRKETSADAGVSLDQAEEADGSALRDTTTTVWIRRDDLSTNIDSPGPGARFMDVTTVLVKPGHEAEFEEGLKLYRAAMQKAAPRTHFTVFSSIYGHSKGTMYLTLSALKSMSEADDEITDYRAMGKATDKATLTKLDEVLSSSVLSMENTMYQIAPGLSYPPPAVVAADPGFWKGSSPQ